MIREIVQRVTE